MGVLNCSRKGCDNIMCYRYSIEYGYICHDCFNELLNSDKKISKFMKGEVAKRKHTYDSLDAEFPMND